MQQQPQWQVSQIKETLKLVGPLPFYDITPTELQIDVISFAGDNFRYFSKKWYEYTMDKYILDIISNGLKLDLKELQTWKIRPTYPLSSKENEIISIEIKNHPKHLKFMFGNLFQFTSISNGYRPAMRIFTKISRVPFRHLRSQGHNSVVYVANSYLQGEITYQSCPLTF